MGLNNRDMMDVAVKQKAAVSALQRCRASLGRDKDYALDALIQAVEELSKAVGDIVEAHKRGGD